MKNIQYPVWFLSYRLCAFIACFIFSSCTVTTNLVHTEGKASDVIDATSKVSPKTAPNISVPFNSPSSPQSVTPAAPAK